MYTTLQTLYALKPGQPPLCYTYGFLCKNRIWQPTPAIADDVLTFQTEAEAQEFVRENRAFRTAAIVAYKLSESYNPETMSVHISPQKPAISPKSLRQSEQSKKAKTRQDIDQLWS